MKNIKTVLAFAVFTVTVFSACSQKQNDDEIDFRVAPVDGGKSVTIVKYMGKKQSVSIPPRVYQFQVTAIGDNAFKDADLISVVIPPGITSIGDGAFQSNMLTKVSVPNSVTAIGDWAFYGNLPLTAINVSQKSANYSSVDGVFYSKNGDLLIQWPVGKTGETVIPANVNIIGKSAFYGCQLTDIAIPDSVTIIEEGAFANNQLTKIAVGANVVSIGKNAFVNNKLESVTISDGVKTIGDYAFSKNNLTSIVIGAEIELEDNWYSAAFDRNFVNLYMQNGRRAGTYTRPNVNSLWRLNN